MTISAPGRLLLKSAGGKYGSATIVYDARKLKATTESVALDDQRLSRSWGSDHLTRILLKAEAPPNKDTWTVTVTP